jgi:NADH-quinone oxidoreductase subunit N
MLPLLGRYNVAGVAPSLPYIGTDSSKLADPYLFFGTLSGDLLNELFNPLYVVLLGLVIGMSMSWTFTNDWGEYFALLFWSTVGMMLLTASEELLTLFLTLETMTICLYLCTAFEKSRRRSAEGGLKYFVYGSVSSALFLFGLSLLYGLTGSTQFSAIRQALYPASGGDATGLSGNVAGATAVLLMLVGFGFKVAAVPFHMWAPDVYDGSPTPVTGYMATAVKAAAFAALLRVLAEAFPAVPAWRDIVWWLAAATMVGGNLIALAQRTVKRMLAYSSIAHAGYVLVAVAAGTSQGAAAFLFYLVAYTLTTLAAFALLAAKGRDGERDVRIDDLAGLSQTRPWLAVALAISMLSLLGFPGTAGFIGKWYILVAATGAGQTALAALLVLTSVISAGYYLPVIMAMYMQPEPAAEAHAGVTLGRLGALAVAGCVAGQLILGVRPNRLLDLATAAALPVSGAAATPPAAPAAPAPPAPPAGPTTLAAPSSPDR